MVCGYDSLTEWNVVRMAWQNGIWLEWLGRIHSMWLEQPSGMIPTHKVGYTGFVIVLNSLEEVYLSGYDYYYYYYLYLQQQQSYNA